jgi:phospholipase/carboxylesterase
MPGVADIVTAGLPANEAAVLCIFVHGRNQTPEDMQSHVIARMKTDKTAFILPRAQEKCWYNALAVSPLTQQTRGELGQSLEDLGKIVRDARLSAPSKPLVLAGFSQGACLSIEHAFSGGDAPEALIAFTGCRVGASSDDRPSALKQDLPVYVSAGSNDPWIPLTAFSEAVLELGKGQAKLRADVFAGRAHEVSDAEIAILDSIISDLAGGQEPGFGAER